MIDIKGFKRDNKPASGSFMKKAALVIATLIVFILVYFPFLLVAI